MHDPLALALTRPVMWMGVQMKLFFANVVFCTLICIDARTWLGLPLFALVHLFMVLKSIKEPHFFFLWLQAWRYTPPVRQSRYWGKTNSYG